MTFLRENIFFLINRNKEWDFDFYNRIGKTVSQTVDLHIQKSPVVDI